jgi:hypothetical protein
MQLGTRCGWGRSSRSGRWTLARAVVGSLVLVAVVGACSSGDDDDSASSTSVPPGGSSTTVAGGAGGSPAGGAAGGAASGGESLSGVWEGSYACAQGQTGLRLTIDDTNEADVGASFEYFPVGGNPDVATGSYTMTGSSSDGTLALEGHEWLEQGGDYTMVGLQADVGGRSDTEALEGTVVGEGCSTFSVDRVSTDMWYVGAWKGAYGCAQGVTGLTLTIEHAADGQVAATYEFYAAPENPGVPSGSFRMTGTYQGGRLELHGSEWIEQPSGYLMVDYESNPAVGIDPHHLFGGVKGPGCTLFTMDKVE